MKKPKKATTFGDPRKLISSDRAFDVGVILGLLECLPPKHAARYREVAKYYRRLASMIVEIDGRGAKS